jgi:hypothetical protein
MNQFQIAKWFAIQSIGGNKDFMTILQVEKMTGEIYLGEKIRKLYAWGYLNIDSQKRPTGYKIKKTYLKLASIHSEETILKGPLSKDITASEYRELSDQAEDKTLI